MERRFQPVLVEEPSVDDTIRSFGASRRSTKSTTASRFSTTPSGRSHPLRSLHLRPPLFDKAIDLIDEAASRLRMEIESLPQPIDKIERNIRGMKVELHLARETDKAAVERAELMRQRWPSSRGSQ